MTRLSEYSEYAYAVGRIRALENSLLERQSLNRLLDEPLPGVCRILEDHGYPPIGEICGGMPEDRDECFISNEFADFKDRCLADTFAELDRLSFHKDITCLLPLRYDCLNLAWILKAKATKEDVPRLFRCGDIEAEDLIQKVEEEGKDLDGVLSEAYREAIVLVESNAPVRLVANACMAAYWRHYLRVARDSGLEMLRLLACYQIDGDNLRRLIRFKSNDSSSLSDLEEELMPAAPSQSDSQPSRWEPIGLEPLGRDFFRRAWGETLESLVGLLTGSHYERAANEALIDGSFDPLVFDRELSNMIVSLLREARVATFGIEPLLAYGIAREIEVTNLKILLGGRAVGLKAESIQEKLRYGYV